MQRFDDFKKELLKDPTVLEEYQNLEPKYVLISQSIRKRLELGLTQKELAKKLNTKQSAVSRFESGNYNPTLEFLGKLAKGLNCKLEINLF